MERPKGIKDKAALEYISYLESELSKYTSSSYKDSYLALKKILDKGNKKLVEVSESDSDIDFDGADFKAISKFLLIQKDYHAQLDYYRGKMNPEEFIRAEKQLMTSNIGLAEKMALKDKNG